VHDPACDAAGTLVLCVSQQVVVAAHAASITKHVHVDCAPTAAAAQALQLLQGYQLH
jgi:hypothetical protein